LQHKGKPFSLPIPGNRLHLVSSKEHWNELNNTSINHLSSHAWSKQHFQPRYTFGYEWPDRRQDDGMPVVRAIRTLSNQFSILKPKFVTIMRNELDEAFRAYIQEDGAVYPMAPHFLVTLIAIGSSKIPLWDTVNHFGSRMNILMMFGDEIGECLPISN
jgi:hypothetical protein